MEIVKTKSGDRYKEKVYLGDGRTITKTFKTKTHAESWKRQTQVERDRNAALGIQPLKENLFFSEIANIWMDTKIHPHRSQKTIADYQSIVNRHLKPFIGDLRLRSVEKSHGSRLQQTLRLKKLSAKTANKIITVLKQVLSFAESEGHLAKNPLRGMAMLKVSSSRTEFLTRQEAIQLLKGSSTEEIYPIILLALNTGMRIGEITGLCWDRIDFDNDRIEVSRSLSRKGLNETTKTHLIRFIPMNEEVKEMLKSLKRSEKFVFLDKSGNPFSPDHFSKRHFEKALNRSGVRKVKFHDLRHTYASNFMMNGGQLYDLQKILGHTKSEMTQRYAHLSPEHMREAVNTVKLSAKGDNSISPYLALRQNEERKLVAV